MKNWHLFPRLRIHGSASPLNQERKEVVPFFILLTLAFFFFYGYSLYAVPALLGFPRLVIFTVLLLLHLVLHWTTLLGYKNTRSILAYLVFQGLLAFWISAYARSPILISGLYMGLIGESFGMLGTNWKGFAALACVLALGFINLIGIEMPGSIIGWMLATAPLALFTIIYVTLFLRQLDARMHAQKLLDELEIANHQLEEDAARIKELTLTAERERMARELHDTLAQGLAGLILQLEAADSHLSGKNPERAQSIIQQAMGRARSTLADSRRTIDDLRMQSNNSSSGLVNDLANDIHNQVDDFKSAAGIPCQLELNLTAEIPCDVQQHALRAVAEGLSNIARYARANHAWVQIATSEDRLEIEIRDDGAGFDPQTGIEQPGHYGLRGLRERARLSGGACEITSSPGSGARIQMHFPLD
jgi:two-component system, NarL family, sensor histidine kinase YdfH